MKGILHRTTEGINDLESDIYHYHFMGYTGKFFFNENGDIITNQHENIIINPIKIGDVIKGWKIITKEGVEYYLGLSKDQTKQATDFSTPALTTSLQSGGGYTIPDPPMSMTNYISSWLLMEIHTPKKETITFEYKSNSIEFWNLINQKKYFWPSHTGPNCTNHAPTTFAINKEKTNRLTRIHTNQGYVQLEYNHERVDLKGDVALTDVKMFDKQGGLIEHYLLNYDYFISTTHLSNNTFGNLDQRRKRLCLKNVIQKKQGNVNKKYQLTYNTAHILPDRFSLSQDFWGYYNGKTNAFFYPTIKYGLNGRYFEINGGDRRINELLVKACILTKIEYPTGGVTEFEFESNRVYNQGTRFFATTVMEEESIYSYNSASSNQNEVTLIIPIKDKADYVGGISWRVDFLQACSNPTGFDCPKATLYYGNNATPIYSTRGEPIENYLDIPEDTDTLKIKVFNYSGEFGDRNDLSIRVYGYKIPSSSEKAALSGGLRIKRIVNKDIGGSILTERRYEYTKFNDPSRSSGAAQYPPTFIFIDKPVCILPSGSLVTANEVSSNSVFPITNGGSYSVGYTNVTEYADVDGKLGKTEYEFSFVYDGMGTLDNIYDPGNYPNTPLHDLSYRRGALLHKTIYKNENGTFDTIQRISRSYIGYDDYNVTSKNIAAENISNVRYPYQLYTNYSGPFYQTKEVSKQYFEEGVITQITNYFYENYPGRVFPLRKETISSKSNKIVVKTYYPDDVTGTTSLGGGSLTAAEYSAVSELKKGGRHRVSEPVQVETWLEGAKLSTRRTTYRDWGNGLVLPERVLVSKGTSPLQPHLQYHRYDGYGNPEDVSLADGPHTVYLWGYGGQYPIAKIENVASYGAVPANLVTAAKNASNTGAEADLIDALNDIRAALPTAHVTTYTYKPLIGVSTVTNPGGEKTGYTYDTFNRLQFIRDLEGKLLEGYQYHYKD